MNSEASNEEDVDRLWEIVAAMRSCMMVTRDDEHYRGRPMAPIARVEENAIYFFTHRDTHKDLEVERDPRVCLTFADESGNRYVSLSGDIQISQDPEEKRRLWSLPLRSQMPEGAEDSAVLLLIFRPQAGEYWEGPSSKLVVAFRMAAAIATGKRADLGDNRKVSL